MTRHLGEFVAALALVAGTWLVSDVVHRRAAQTTPAPVVTPAKVDPTLAHDSLDLRTGDSFWGLRLEGVIPCSSMIVRGGGHLVMLSFLEMPEHKSYFHVKDSKRVELAGLSFDITVTGADMVHVDKSPVEHLAARES